VTPGLDLRFKNFPIIEQLIQLSLGAVPMAELLPFAGFVHSNSSASRKTLQLEHQFELLAPDMMMELSAELKVNGWEKGSTVRT
jgi:hypothetical protein